MFWIALELSIPKIGLNITLSLTVKKLDAYKFDGFAESGNTEDAQGKNICDSMRNVDFCDDDAGNGLNELSFLSL